MNGKLAAADTTARENILSRIKSGLPKAVELPEIPMYRIKGDVVENFIRHLESFDGTCKRFARRKDAIEWLHDNIDPGKATVYSSVEGFEGNFTVRTDTDPHSANVVDICIGEGEIGVGETGSVWVTEKSLGLTACALFSTDLYLLLDINNLYEGIHQAYEALNLRDIRYGAFFTGPSATADIEAVRVTGAQGEITLTVLLTGELPGESF